jgi:hypothetical protein
VRILKTRRQKVDHIEFGPHGGLLAYGRDEAAYWANPTTDDKPLKVSRRYIWGAAVIGAGAHIAVSNSAGIHLHRLVDGHLEQVLGEGQRGYSITAAGVSAILLHGVSVPLIAYAVSPEGIGQHLWYLEWDEDRPHFRTGRPCATPDGNEFYQFEWRGWHHPGGAIWLTRRDVRTGQLVAEVAVHEFADDGVRMSPDGRLLAHIADAKARVFDVSSGTALGPTVIENTASKHFTGLAFHPSGRFLAATSNDATVKLYDTSNWSLATTYTWDVGRMRSVAFSPDGLLAVAGSDTGKVVVWDVDV